MLKNTGVECNSVAEYAKAVDAVREDLRARGKGDIEHVLMTTDETDPAYLNEARSMGWTVIDEALSLEVRKVWGDW
jgi:hypothetical protein